MAFEFQGKTYVECEVCGTYDDEVEFILYLSDDPHDEGETVCLETSDNWDDLDWPEEMITAFENWCAACAEIRDEARAERAYLYGGRY